MTISSTESKHGQFLWMPKSLQRQYIKGLRQRIDDGYYFSDKILEKIIEKLAPVFDGEVDRNL